LRSDHSLSTRLDYIFFGGVVNRFHRAECARAARVNRAPRQCVRPEGIGLGATAQDCKMLLIKAVAPSWRESREKTGNG